MKRKGLVEVTSPATMTADFDKASQEVWKELVGKVYTQDELDMVLKFRKEYRDKHPAAAPKK